MVPAMAPELRESLIRNMRNSDGSVMRGDPRGVSGRLNNTSEMWAVQQQQQQQPQQTQQPQQQQQQQQPQQPQPVNKIIPPSGS